LREKAQQREELTKYSIQSVHNNNNKKIYCLIDLMMGQRRTDGSGGGPCPFRNTEGVAASARDIDWIALCVLHICGHVYDDSHFVLSLLSLLFSPWVVQLSCCCSDQSFKVSTLLCSAYTVHMYNIGGNQSLKNCVFFFFLLVSFLIESVRTNAIKALERYTHQDVDDRYH
jgi:hypothetical protein